ncbi:MAG: PspC domain-containing protein [Bacteroidetes bacterium]|nr:PspC domain-containing protein [Bacteroidota bacterium]
MEPRRLYRSTTDKKIGGVCGGLAEYFDIDPLLIRLLFVIVALVGGGGVLLYIILWIITPEKPFALNQPGAYSEPIPKQDPYERPATPPEPAPAEKPAYKVTKAPRSRGSLIGALVLITLGVLFLADEFIPRLSFGDLWPVILIVIGIGLLANSMSKRRNN